MSKNIPKIALSIIISLTLAGCNLSNKTNNNNQKIYDDAYNLSQQKNISLIYECEKQFTDENAKRGCKDFVLKDADYTGNYYGHDCPDAETCLAEQEGYDWAEENNINTKDACLAYSEQFLIGCQTAVNDNTALTNDDATKAIDIVKNLAEVKAWLKQFSNEDGTSPITGGKAIVAVDSVNGDVYSIHAFESLTERNVTFNWYDVNLKTGIVTNSLGQVVK